MRDKSIENKIDELLDIMNPHLDSETMILHPELFEKFNITLFEIRKMTVDRETVLEKIGKIVSCSND